MSNRFTDFDDFDYEFSDVPHFDEDACKDPPNLDEQMSSTEFRLTSLEANHSYLSMNIQEVRKELQKIKKDIHDSKNEYCGLANRISFGDIFQRSQSELAPEELKQYDTLPCDCEPVEEELPPDFWGKGNVTTVEIPFNDGRISSYKIKFPNLEMVTKFLEGKL